MATIYCFKNFNNYANRRLKGAEINDVNTFTTELKNFEYFNTSTNLNFNPGDGANAYITLGSKENPYNGDCDYLLYCEDNITITSRWFIIDHDFMRGNQYKLELRRDAVAEKWAKIVNADCFIEKAILNDNDPLIFNDEAITVNQIKKDELKLYDESGCQWIVGYMNKKHENTNPTTIEANAVADITGATKAALETAIGGEEDTEYIKLQSIEFYLKIYRVKSFYAGVPNSFDEYTYRRTTGGWVLMSRTYKDALYNTLFVTDLSESDILSYLNANVTYNICYNSYNMSEYIDPSEAAIYDTLLTQSGKIGEVTTPSDPDAGYYKINLTTGTEQAVLGNSTLNTALNNALASIKRSGSGSAKIDHANVVAATVKYMLEATAYGGYTATLGAVSSRLHCNTSFDVFAIPYKDTTIQNSAISGWKDILLSKSLALSIAQGLAVALDDNLYDLQLLPYNPINGITFSAGYIDVNTANAKAYTIVYDGQDPACILFWATQNTGTKYISNLGKTWLAAGNKKINNQCDFIRLVSPNYAGSYEMNVAKNEGVNEIKIDFTYIPYRPYIHVAPTYNVNGLYGDHNDDAVGLICGGDFSISYLSDAWEKYMTENKNYADIFDRTTQNMDTNYKYQRIESALGAGIGAIAAGVTGGVINPALGVVGGIASAAGGIADLAIQQKLHNEAMDYRSDLFGMQLDNIKALPYSLAKVSTINENNKGVPFIEYYSCTDREKAAVALKIAYNSMTVGCIGKLADYIINRWNYGEIEDRGYIKAKIIRLEDISEDTHIANVIADELNRGVYLR